MSSAVEDIVCRYLNKVTTTSLNSSCKVAWSRGIQEEGTLRFTLGTVNSGVGGTIDNDINGVAVHEGFYSSTVGDVKGNCWGGYISEKPMMVRILCSLQLHLIA